MIETLKNLANIGFFLVVSVVTVLSYLQARKTLFSPIRTETFKLQLKAFEEVLLYFQNKSESDFLDVFDLERILSLNSLRMADAYVDAFFPDEIKVAEEERRKLYSPLVGGIVSAEHAQKYFEKLEPAKPAESQRNVPEPITNPAIVFARWQEYEHGMIEYTRKYSDQLKELEKLGASPLLPKSLRDLIGEFRGIAHNSLTAIGTAVDGAAKNMPKHFPRAADMRKFDSGWIWNDFNDDRNNFEPVVKKILDNINVYLKVEDLMSGAD